MSYTNKYLPGVVLQTPQEVAAYIAANPGDERARWWKIAPSPQNPLGLTTDDIPEGLANLYYNPSRVTKEIQDAVDGLDIPVASDADPMALGVADPGISDEFSRGDHAHPMPSAADVGAEPAISGGTAAQYLSGLKAWADFATSVRDTMLVGLSTASSAIIAFGDTVLSALGKLQAQITLRLPINNPTFTGTMQGPYLRISSLASGLNGVPVSNFVGELSVKTADQFRIYASCAYSGDIGQPNGIASLDATGRVPSGQLPSYVDDVVEVANFAALPGTGEAGKIYITLDDNKTWRWSGSGYTEISASLALGETSATAYPGDLGKIAYTHSQIATGNPHGTTAADVGAAKAPSKIDVSASANLGSIDASAIKVTATDVTLTCSGGFDGQGWDIIGPEYALGIGVPSGVTLYRYAGITVGPATYAPGGGRALRVVRVDATTWLMPNLS